MGRIVGESSGAAYDSHAGGSEFGTPQSDGRGALSPAAAAGPAGLAGMFNSIRFRNPEPHPRAMNQVVRESLDEPRLSNLLRELGEEARAMRFSVAPNPCVGAAVLNASGQVLARGFHDQWGGPHAEINALEAARAAGTNAADWDTLVVTLEPCSSAGKTGPCTEAILKAGLRRVVVGALDPDPRHLGQGLNTLSEQGVEVELLEFASPLEVVSPHFLAWTDSDRQRRPRPWTIAKWAQTRSGQLQPPEDVGDGRWISSPESQREVQVLRSQVDAIVTGVGTVLADDPRLTIRSPGDLNSAPVRVVLDTYLRTPPDARILERPEGDEEAGGETWILCRAGASSQRHTALLEAGAKVITVRLDFENEDGGLSLRAVQELLWERGLRRILVEAGATLQSAYMQSQMVDQLRVYVGAVNGGRGQSLDAFLDPMQLAQRLDRELGGDSIIEAFTRDELRRFGGRMSR